MPWYHPPRLQVGLPLRQLSALILLPRTVRVPLTGADPATTVVSSVSLPYSRHLHDLNGLMQNVPPLTDPWDRMRLPSHPPLLAAVKVLAMVKVPPPPPPPAPHTR